MNTRPITTTPRAPHGWRAFLTERPGVFADGATKEAAVAALVALLEDEE